MPRPGAAPVAGRVGRVPYFHAVSVAPDRDVHGAKLRSAIMGSFSIWHWLIVLAVVLLLFGGRGKISQLMGDFGKGLKAFKKGVGGEDEAAAAQPGDAAKPIQATTASAAPGAAQPAKDAAAKT